MKTGLQITADDFQKYYWFTPAQRRNMLIEEACVCEGGLTTEIASHIKNLGQAEQARRKSLPEQFVECTYCKGYHDQVNNNDKLCEKCEYTVHFLRWDIEHRINP